MSPKWRVPVEFVVDAPRLTTAKDAIAEVQSYIDPDDPAFQEVEFDEFDTYEIKSTPGGGTSTPSVHDA